MAFQIVVAALNNGQQICELFHQPAVDVVQRDQPGNFHVFEQLLKSRKCVDVDMLLENEHLIAVLGG